MHGCGVLGFGRNALSPSPSRSGVANVGVVVVVTTVVAFVVNVGVVNVGGRRRRHIHCTYTLYIYTRSSLVARRSSFFLGPTRSGKETKDRQQGATNNEQQTTSHEHLCLCMCLCLCLCLCSKSRYAYLTYLLTYFTYLHTYMLTRIKNEFSAEVRPLKKQKTGSKWTFQAIGSRL